MTQRDRWPIAALILLGAFCRLIRSCAIYDEGDRIQNLSALRAAIGLGIAEPVFESAIGAQPVCLALLYYVTVPGRWCFLLVLGLFDCSNEPARCRCSGIISSRKSGADTP
jgi:hypothetical protein